MAMLNSSILAGGGSDRSEQQQGSTREEAGLIISLQRCLAKARQSEREVTSKRAEDVSQRVDKLTWSEVRRKDRSWLINRLKE